MVEESAGQPELGLVDVSRIESHVQPISNISLRHMQASVLVGARQLHQGSLSHYPLSEGPSAQIRMS